MRTYIHRVALEPRPPVGSEAIASLMIGLVGPWPLAATQLLLHDSPVLYAVAQLAIAGLFGLLAALLRDPRVALAQVAVIAGLVGSGALSYLTGFGFIELWLAVYAAPLAGAAVVAVPRFLRARARRDRTYDRARRDLARRLGLEDGRDTVGGVLRAAPGALPLSAHWLRRERDREIRVEERWRTAGWLLESDLGETFSLEAEGVAPDSEALRSLRETGEAVLELAAGARVVVEGRIERGHYRALATAEAGHGAITGRIRLSPCCPPRDRTERDENAQVGTPGWATRGELATAKGKTDGRLLGYAERSGGDVGEGRRHCGTLPARSPHW